MVWRHNSRYPNSGSLAPAQRSPCALGGDSRTILASRRDFCPAAVPPPPHAADSRGLRIQDMAEVKCPPASDAIHTARRSLAGHSMLARLSKVFFAKRPGRMYPGLLGPRNGAPQSLLTGPFKVCKHNSLLMLRCSLGSLRAFDASHFCATTNLPSNSRQTGLKQSLNNAAQSGPSCHASAAPSTSPVRAVARIIQCDNVATWVSLFHGNSLDALSMRLVN